MEPNIKAKLKQERLWIDSLTFEELYRLHMDWSPLEQISRTSHYRYVKLRLAEQIRGIPQHDYFEFVKYYNSTK